jgi:hypothetical protein
VARSNATLFCVIRADLTFARYRLWYGSALRHEANASPFDLENRERDVVVRRELGVLYQRVDRIIDARHAQLTPRACRR